MMTIKYKFEIITTTMSLPAEKLADELQEVFTEAGIVTKVINQRSAVKSFEPLNITFTIVGQVLLPYVVGRYFFDPAFSKAEEVVSRWKSVMKKNRTSIQPIHLKINFVTEEVEIESSPYLADEQFLENLFENLGKMLWIIHQAGLTQKTKRIRLISEEIDKIKIIGYLSAKPAYSVNLEDEKIESLSDVDMKTLDPTGSEDEYRYNLILRQRKLYEQILDRMKK